jgi:hypothetical protein
MFHLRGQKNHDSDTTFGKFAMGRQKAAAAGLKIPDPLSQYSLADTRHWPTLGLKTGDR